MFEVEVPADIWQCIAQFIPPDALQNLYSVNRVFFEISMAIKYRRIYLDFTNPATMRILLRLCDPNIARHVRLLQLVLNDKFYERENLKASSSPSKKFTKKMLTGARIVDRILNAESQSKMTGQENVIKAVISVVPGLVNVTELALWDMSRSASITALYHAAWSSFGRNLHSVSFGGYLDGYRMMLDSNPPLDSIHELSFNIKSDYNQQHQSDDTILVDKLSQFLNRFSSQLHSLNIRSFGAIDLSFLFLSIDYFPHLRNLSIGTQKLSSSFKKDTAGLSRLLANTHTTLRSLDLRIGSSGIDRELDHAAEVLLADWLVESCLSNHQSIFQNLQDLKIFPSRAPDRPDLIRRIVEGCSANLKELVLLKRTLRMAEITALTDALSTNSYSNLGYLRLNIWKLDISVFDHFAEKLPRLRRLDLFVDNAFIQLSSNYLLGLFRDQIQTRNYPNWKLDDIGIWWDTKVKLDYETMALIARSIPSIQSIWGHNDEIFKPTLLRGYISAERFL